MSQTKPVRNTNKDCLTNNETIDKGNQMYRWCFTIKSSCEPNEPAPVGINNNIEGGGISAAHTSALKREAKSLWNTLNKWSKEFYFQLERGEEGGYLHYQGCLSLTVKERFATVKNILGRNDAHIEPCRNWNATKLYCAKEETRIMGPWNHKSVWINTITTLYAWQQKVIEMINKPCEDDREIHWFYDSKGAKGKTALCKYLYTWHSATVVNNGAFADLAYVLPEDPKIVCFALPRTLESRVNYSAIEAIKDGMIFSGKYESRTKVFNSPHILVFANFLPNFSSLSLDRWRVHDLNDSEGVGLTEYSPADMDWDEYNYHKEIEDSYYE